MLLFMAFVLNSTTVWETIKDYNKPKTIKMTVLLNKYAVSASIMMNNVNLASFILFHYLAELVSFKNFLRFYDSFADVGIQKLQAYVLKIKPFEIWSVQYWDSYNSWSLFINIYFFIILEAHILIFNLNLSIFNALNSVLGLTNERSESWVLCFPGLAAH